jgi:prepilin-type N-terminal cleavage/methylation domain-containing protein
MKVAQVANLPYRRLEVGRRHAFSLIEIMLAVALMTIIMLGLLAMFYQTQRAMRVGNAQVNVMGTGDAAIHLMANEIKQVVAAGDYARILGGGQPRYIPHLEATNRYLPLFWTRSFGGPQVTYLQELFFIRRENDDWVGTGYFVDPVTDQGGAGVLYRFERVEPTWKSNAIPILYNAFQTANRTTVPRLADRIAHLQLHAFNADGTNLTLPNLTFTNLDLPSYIDLELAVLEPKPYDRFRARHDSNDVNTPLALAYLTNQLDRLHIFRRRIPIRTVQ